MDQLDGFQMHRVVSVPRRAAERTDPDPAREQLYAAWVAAHAALRSAPDPATAACAVLWIRPPGVNRVGFYVGGRPWFPPAAGGLFLYPLGARAISAPSFEDLGLVEAFPSWISCAGQPDALWKPGYDDARQQPSIDLGDIVAHMRQPFAWLILAEPCAPAEIEGALADLGTLVPRLRQRENAQADRIRLQQAEERYRELSKARSVGAWRVRVLAGATNAADAHQAAAILCGFSTRTALPYVLVPGSNVTALADLLGERNEPQRGLVPFIATADLLAEMAGPPQRELPGIEASETPDFDVTAGQDETGGFELGTILDHTLAPVQPLLVSRSTLNRHAFVCGATGSGKSQTVRTLLESLSTAHDPVPWLVIEPAKAEYRGMAGRLSGTAEVIAVRPGDPDVAPVGLNPLEPEPGFPLQGHADLIRALFLAAFEAQEPFPQILAAALTKVYQDAGWDIVLNVPHPRLKPKFLATDPGEPVHLRYPTLHDFQATARQVVEQVGYGREVTDNVRGFIDVRIGSLRQGAPGLFFEGGYPLDISELLRRNVVLELESVTDDQDKAFFIGIVLIRIVEHLRVHPPSTPDGHLRHVTVIEEAHRLLRNSARGPGTAAVELFASLLAEVRAYGEGVLVVEQIPDKILPDVIKNTALKIMHRLPGADDRKAVGDTINLTKAQSAAVLSMPPGTAAVSMDGMDHPLQVQMPLGSYREHSDGVSRSVPPSAPHNHLCDSWNTSMPCTLREIRQAQLIASEREIVMWVEAVVASYVTGLDRPRFSHSACFARLSSVPRRRLACVLAQAVERAITARRPWLHGVIDADDMAKAVLQTLLAQFGQADPDPTNPLRWTCGIYRYADIVAALRARLDDAENESEPISQTVLDEWSARGAPLRGGTPAERLLALYSSSVFAPWQVMALTGDPKSSGLAEALGRPAGQLTEAHIENTLLQACTGDHLHALAAELTAVLGPPIRPKEIGLDT